MDAYCLCSNDCNGLKSWGNHLFHFYCLSAFNASSECACKFVPAALKGILIGTPIFGKVIDFISAFISVHIHWVRGCEQLTFLRKCAFVHAARICMIIQVCVVSSANYDFRLFDM